MWIIIKNKKENTIHFISKTIDAYLYTILYLHSSWIYIENKSSKV